LRSYARGRTASAVHNTRASAAKRLAPLRSGAADMDATGVPGAGRPSVPFGGTLGTSSKANHRTEIKLTPRSHQPKCTIMYGTRGRRRRVRRRTDGHWGAGRRRRAKERPRAGQEIVSRLSASTRRRATTCPSTGTRIASVRLARKCDRANRTMGSRKPKPTTPANCPQFGHNSEFSSDFP